MFALVSRSSRTVNSDPDVVLHVYGFIILWLCIPCVIHAELSDFFLQAEMNDLKLRLWAFEQLFWKRRPKMKWKMQNCRTFFILKGSKNVAEKSQLSYQYVRLFAIGSAVVNLLKKTLVSDHKKTSRSFGFNNSRKIALKKCYFALKLSNSQQNCRRLQKFFHNFLHELAFLIRWVIMKSTFHNFLPWFVDLTGKQVWKRHKIE